MAEDSDFNWTVELEVSLFHAMRKHKPVGIPKHFQMTFIHEKLNSAITRYIPTSQIWKHLSTMYDLQALDTSEIVPFPNKEIEFSLPKEGYEEIFAQEFPRAQSSEAPVTSSVADEDKDYAAVSSVKETSITPTSGSTSTKDRDRHGSGSSRGKSDKQERHTKEEKLAAAEETPKRDARKRTRHSLQSPATDTIINKRQRRT